MDLDKAVEEVIELDELEIDLLFISTMKLETVPLKRWRKFILKHELLEYERTLDKMLTNISTTHEMLHLLSIENASVLQMKLTRLTVDVMT